MAGHAAGDRMHGEFDIDAIAGQGIVQFADAVLGLGHGHAVTGDDDHGAGGFHDLCGVLGSCAFDGALLDRARGGLDLAEGAEEDVGKRAVHGLAHDDREDEAGGAVEGPGGDQELVVEHEAHGHGRQPGVGIQKRDDGGHVGAADGNDQEHAEGQRDQDNQREQQPAARKDHQQHAGQNSHAQEREIDRVLAFVGDGPGGDDFHELAGRH